MGYHREGLSPEEASADRDAYGRLADRVAGAPDAAGPDDPDHLLRLAGHVHAQLAFLAGQACSRGIPGGRAWGLALAGLDAALAGPEAVRAVTSRTFEPAEIRRVLPYPTPMDRVAPAFAGWSEADFLSHNANLWLHNIETTSRTYYAAKLGWNFDDAVAAWHKGAAAGRLQGAEFARAVDDLMGAAAAA
jgi:hypothetical protein